MISEFDEVMHIVADTHKRVLFKYPAHDIESFAIATHEILTWIEMSEPGDEYHLVENMCENLAYKMNTNVPITIQNEAQKWEALTAYEYDDMRMVGVALNTELWEEEVGDVKVALEHNGYEVVDVEYGSEVHNAWNKFIRD